MASAPTKFHFFLCIALPLICLALPATSAANTLPGCPDKCGDITIPYPFGTQAPCYREGFDLTCNDSFSPPKLILGTNIEVLEINITSAEVRVHNYIAYACYNQTNQKQNYSNITSIDLNKLSSSQVRVLSFSDSPYLFSSRRNKFTVIGCYTLAYIAGQGDSPYQSGCVSFCEGLNSTTGNGGSCNGLGCCQTSIPESLHYYDVTWGFEQNEAWQFNPCTYAALMQEDWYNFSVKDLEGFGLYERNKQYAPVVLDWAIRTNGVCLESHMEDSNSRACQSNHSRCDNTTNGEGYICRCLVGYDGNPYIPDGCIDIDECNFPDMYPCAGKCYNTDGSYECPCPKGTDGDGKTGNCHKIPEKFPQPARVAIYSILGIAIFLGLCFLLVTYQQHKRHGEEKEKYQRYYQMMDNHLRVFSKKEIENATNNFRETSVLGAGGQGKVYKGLLENNEVVAIKKAKEIEETQRGEFVNEIILLSQINHKNIVRLLGCCLEVKIPMLVYEYVPGGTLFELLHGKCKPMPIPLGIRLRIALESAEALDYLHSSISRSIIHGDIKSANILLEDNYRAKVSDFGASNLVPIDDTQVVKVVQGTRGYIDPEYVATAVLTKKSDVYSFGVVLLEHITRKCAIFIDELTDERKHLASCFVSNARKNKLHELLDKELIRNDDHVIEVLQEVSELAVWCLNVKGEDRPTMRQVVDKLQCLIRDHESLLVPQMCQEEREDPVSLLSTESTIFSVSDVSAFHTAGYSSVMELETERLR